MNSDTKKETNLIFGMDVFDEGARHPGSGFQKNVKFISSAIFLTIQNHSWTPKTCFDFGLDCLLFM